MRHERGDEDHDVPPWAVSWERPPRYADVDGYAEVEPADQVRGGGLRWPHGMPGSAEALAAGCLCPVLPNHPRAGLDLLIAPDCPVHA